MWHGGLPSGSEVKNSPAKAGDLGSTPGSGRSSEEGNGNPLQYSCWEIPRTEELGGLQSMGLQTVGQDLATKQCGSAVSPVTQATGTFTVLAREMLGAEGKTSCYLHVLEMLSSLGDLSLRVFQFFLSLPFISMQHWSSGAGYSFGFQSIKEEGLTRASKLCLSLPC